MSSDKQISYAPKMRGAQKFDSYATVNPEGEGDIHAALLERPISTVHSTSAKLVVSHAVGSNGDEQRTYHLRGAKGRNLGVQQARIDMFAETQMVERPKQLVPENDSNLFFISFAVACFLYYLIRERMMAARKLVSSG